MALTKKRSGRPSPSASKKTTPEPMVSGRYLRPRAPLLWVRRMPAGRVAWVKVTGIGDPVAGAGVGASAAGRPPQAQSAAATAEARRARSPVHPAARRRGARLIVRSFY